MGYGEYSHAAHVALTREHERAAEPVFDATGGHPLMDPRGVVSRESRDSDEHPESLAVVLALDVTGSMGDIPRRLATETLPDFVQTLLDARVAHPQICFMAVGQAGVDRVPLQVGQFESSAALIDTWLTRLYLEGGGKGLHESYELAMYFAARHTELDCVDKRGRRGFVFVTADVLPNPAVSRTEVRRIIGDELESDIPLRDVVDELGRRYEPFVLLAPHASRRARRAWRDILGDRVLVLEDLEDAADVAAGLVALIEGAAASLAAHADRLRRRGLGQKQVARIARALVPFAASIGRDGAPAPNRRRARLPRADRPSGMQRP